jgi:hypothetical protein
MRLPGNAYDCPIACVYKLTLHKTIIKQGHNR